MSSRKERLGLGVVVLIDLIRTFSTCQLAPANAYMLTLSGVSVGLDGEPATRLDTHRSGTYPTSCWQQVGYVVGPILA